MISLSVSPLARKKKKKKKRKDDERMKALTEKRQRREERGRDIKPELGEKSGWRPKAIKTVLHVEPTNISEVLNMNPIRPGPEQEKGGRKKQEMKRYGENGSAFLINACMLLRTDVLVPCLLCM